MEIHWRRAPIVLAVVGAIALLAGCGDIFPGGGGGTTLTADIDTATTLDGTYTISSSIWVNAVLTIAPGTTLKFASGTWMWVSSTGSIVADGADGDEITFTSAATTKAKGDWTGVGLDTGANGCLFDYCIFEYAETGLEVDSATTVTNCTFQNDTNGLDASAAGSAMVITSNTFTSNTEPVYINASYSFDASNTFTSNTNQRIYFSDGDFDADATWSETEVPYYVATTTWVNAHLTLAPSLTLEFAPSTWLWMSDTGYLTADAASGTEITFTSSKASPAAGDWTGLGLDSGSSGSVFDYCIFEYAETAIDLSSGGSATVTNCTYTSCTNTVVTP